jgi:peptide chain release factor 1
MKDKFRVTYSRGSGPGGQRKNKVETCVVITHKETGMQERCQDTPSQARNLQIAMDRLFERIKAYEERKRVDVMQNVRKKIMEQKKPIRTYNFPRGVVIDHRTGIKARLKDILNGKLNLLR